MRIVIIILLSLVLLSCENNPNYKSSYLYYLDENFHGSIKLFLLKNNKRTFLYRYNIINHSFDINDTVIYEFNSGDAIDRPYKLKIVRFAQAKGKMNTYFNYILDDEKRFFLTPLKPVIPTTTSYQESKTYKIGSKDYKIDKFYLDEQDSLYFYKTYYLENFGFLCYYGVYENYTFVIRDFKNPHYTKEEIRFLVDTLFRDSTFFEYYREIARITNYP